MAHRDPDEMPDAYEREKMCLLMDTLRSVGAPWAMIRQELVRMTCLPNPPFESIPSQRTLQRMLLEHFECQSMAELDAKRVDTVGVTLKARAVMMALQGNVPMLIFCLKNLAGWSDMPTNPDDEKHKPKVFGLNYKPEDVRNKGKKA